MPPPSNIATDWPRSLKYWGGLGLLLSSLLGGCQPPTVDDSAFAGSKSCRECHEKFYELWSTSYHGLAMQPVTPEFCRAALQPLTQAITIEGCRYTTNDDASAVIEEGPQGERRYPIIHAMGGKYLYYFLTQLDRGRLQVLPLAYDTLKNEWFDAADSMVRHFSDGSQDTALSWHDSLLTFNTSCFSCHVSQLSLNYDLTLDSYRTTWREPGISCESCHGPCGEHIQVCRQAAAQGREPQDLKLIKQTTMTRRQSDDTCATCHAKARPISADFTPTDHFFDHYDLTTFEHHDFYPDGCDLGENYTYTQWLTSPCEQSEQLGCVHCHTSSGRYRFAGQHTNHSCLPCHQERVDNATAHTHHRADSPGNQCVACHMPMTSFARMHRSDHSMRPPMPAATLAFNSPNACNLCHEDQDAHWADQHVRAWHRPDYQQPHLERGHLIAAARAQNWKNLDAILAWINDPTHDPIYATALLRLLDPCTDARKWPTIRQALQHPHPLMRSSAARQLAHNVTEEHFKLLVKAADDQRRLVRIAAATALARYPTGLLELPSAQSICERAFQELEASFDALPDSWVSHYNRGNYYADRGWRQPALTAYAHATRLRPDMVEPLVNAAMLHAQSDNLEAAIEHLQKALKINPDSLAVHLNLGMAWAELTQSAKAISHFRHALRVAPDSAQAAYNLGILLNQPCVTAEGLEYARRAGELEPDQPNYIYTYAYFLAQTDQASQALAVLQAALQRGVTSQALRSLAQSLQHQLQP